MDTTIVQPARYCTHGYELCVRGADGILRHDAAALQDLPPTDPRALAYLADPINRKLAEDLGAITPARPILAYSRTTGAALELVPSASEPGKFHLVDPVNRQCDCKGWEYRRTCRHLSLLAPARPVYDGIKIPLVARLQA